MQFLKKFKLKIPGPGSYFWLVFSIWTLIGLFFGSQYFFRFGLENIDNIILKGYAVSFIYVYLYALLFPILLKVFRKLQSKQDSVLGKIFIYSMIGLFSTLITTSIKLLSIIFIIYGGISSFIEIKYFVISFIGYSYLGMFCYIFDLLIIFTKEYYNRYKERELKTAQLEIELLQAQLQALKVQLHPHFLFNTLNSIAALIRDKDNKTALKMTTSLSNFLRYTLSSYSKEFVPLMEELEMIYLYLQIEQIRFSDRLKLTFNISPEVKNTRIPNLLLQPIVENAVRHGISKRTDAGKIDIDIVKDNENIKITIKDDGPGLDNDISILKQKGIGIKNTITRLEKIYQDNFRFSLTNINHYGVKVEIAIPYQLFEG